MYSPGLAIPLLHAVGSVLCGLAWKGHKVIAIGLIAGIAIGELYNLGRTAERLTAMSEAAQAPRREYAKLS
jgi:hypothetical protein